MSTPAHPALPPIQHVPPVTPTERAALLTGFAATVLAVLASWKWDLWWATLPALAILAAQQTSRLVKSARSGYRDGVTMSVWGIALCAFGGASTAGWGWALWAMAVTATAGMVWLLIKSRQDTRRWRQLAERIRELQQP
jgi:hypothetical protein